MWLIVGLITDIPPPPALPYIILPPVSQDVLQNTFISLLCNASGVPTPDITWWKTWSNGSSMLVLEDQRIVIMTTSEMNNVTSELIIEQAQPSDAGNYTCTATNVVGSVSATANVFVQGKTTGPLYNFVI